MSGIFSMFSGRGGKDSQEPFEVRLRESTSGERMLLVEVKGPIGNQGTSISYSLCIEDVTDGSAEPLMLTRDGHTSLVDSFTLTSGFCTVSEFLVNKDWAEALQIPLSKIQFARKGRRELKANLIVNGGAVSGGTTYTYNQKEPGFKNVADAKYALYSAVFCLVCGFRAEYPAEGDNAIQAAADWLLAECTNWTVTEKQEVFARFSNLAESIPPVVGWSEACEKYCEPIRERANADFRNGIIRLFYSVLVGEKELEVVGKELNLFYELCVAIGTDMEVFSRLTDRLILVCDLTQYEPDMLLGVHEQMSTDDVKAHLRNEYKKWNERVTHSDELVRDKASYMMKLISERRGTLNTAV